MSIGGVYGLHEDNSMYWLEDENENEYKNANQNHTNAIIHGITIVHASPSHN